MTTLAASTLEPKAKASNSAAQTRCVHPGLTEHLTAAELHHFHKLFPGATVDETAFESNRLRFRLGQHTPGFVCASSSTAPGQDRQTVDT
ncbi:unnamed protein product, partial [Symbiodinium necroappetens]